MTATTVPAPKLESADSGAAAPSTASTAAVPSRSAVWTGRVLSGLAIAFLLMDAMMKVLQSKPALEGTVQAGYSAAAVPVLGWILLLSLAVYAFPKTSGLGALLLTGYLGGAVATNVRMGNPMFSHVLFPVYVAAFVWLGLWLRDGRLRAVLPLRTR